MVFLSRYTLVHVQIKESLVISCYFKFCINFKLIIRLLDLIVAELSDMIEDEKNFQIAAQLFEGKKTYEFNAHEVFHWFHVICVRDCDKNGAFYRAIISIIIHIQIVIEI